MFQTSTPKANRWNRLDSRDHPDLPLGACHEKNSHRPSSRTHSCCWFFVSWTSPPYSFLETRSEWRGSSEWHKIRSNQIRTVQILAKKAVVTVAYRVIAIRHVLLFRSKPPSSAHHQGSMIVLFTRLIHRRIVFVSCIGLHRDDFDCDKSDMLAQVQPIIGYSWRKSITGTGVDNNQSLKYYFIPVVALIMLY